jgi:hypothetical protein
LSEKPVLPDLTQWDSKEELDVQSYSPISTSPSQDPKKKKVLGHCHEDFKASISLDHLEVIWTLSDFAKAGKLLKSMDVVFYDEYEMRKIYSLIYDVFRCEYLLYLLSKLVCIMIFFFAR